AVIALHQGNLSLQQTKTSTENSTNQNLCIMCKFSSKGKTLKLQFSADEAIGINLAQRDTQSVKTGEPARLNLKGLWEAGRKVAQWVKELVTKPDDLGLIPGTHAEELSDQLERSSARKVTVLGVALSSRLFVFLRLLSLVSEMKEGGFYLSVLGHRHFLQAFGAVLKILGLETHLQAETIFWSDPCTNLMLRSDVLLTSLTPQCLRVWGFNTWMSAGTPPREQ
ncbi:hypothetical protein STEG23_033694, partial [Scotinomys teguina]